MLGITPLRNTSNEGDGEKIASSFYIGGEEHIDDDFQDFSSDNLLDSIDFDDMFVGMENEVDVLPDLEMDTEILGDFSVDSTAGEESEIVNYNPAAASASSTDIGNNNDINSTIIYSTKEDDKVSGSAGSGTSSLNQGEEIVSRKRDKSAKGVENKGKKSSKNHQGKKKVKVDWTPELHRRFVQVVEQLGVDKAVPSRILELMGIDCLTRHNIASHLQKYRSHRKHLLAREAEAASWSQRRQIYNGGVAGGGCKREMINKPNWFSPTMAFPPMPHFRVPLHVWGHPPALWPAAAAAASDPLLSHPRLQIPNSMPLGTPCFQPPPTTTPTNFPAPPPVPGLPPHAIYKADAAAAVHSTAQPCPRPPIDFQPSKESIDAAIEDVLAKPWLPLPLGLKPPSTDSVVMELHLQGIEKIPPTG